MYRGFMYEFVDSIQRLIADEFNGTDWEMNKLYNSIGGKYVPSGHMIFKATSGARAVVILHHYLKKCKSEDSSVSLQENTHIADTIVQIDLGAVYLIYIIEFSPFIHW